MDNPRAPDPGEPDGFGPLRLPLPDGMPWLAEAVRMLETGGVRLDDERQKFVLRASEFLDRHMPFDVAWCGLFVYHCIKTAYPDSPTPFLPMRARPWLGYGRPVEPQVGALMLFWLYWPSSPLGHSGFCWAEDEESYHIIGGNQRNKIRVQRVGRSRLLGARWPEEAWPPPGILRSADPAEAAPFEWGEAKDHHPGLTPLPQPRGRS